MYVCLWALIHVQLLATLWTIACQAPLSMGLSRQEYWSELPCPPSRVPPHPGFKPTSRTSPILQADSLLLSHKGSPIQRSICWIKEVSLTEIGQDHNLCHYLLFSSNRLSWAFLFFLSFFLVGLGLCCCKGVSLVATGRNYPLVLVHGLLTVMPSLVEHEL